MTDSIRVTKKRVNSRQKGKAAERQACEFLRGLGFTAQRTAQNRGKTGDCADIEVNELPGVHFEVKHRKGIDLGTKELANAVAQAESECGDRTPVVLWKRNGSGWRLTVCMTDHMSEANHRATLDDSESIRVWLRGRMAIRAVGS